MAKNRCLLLIVHADDTDDTLLKLEDHVSVKEAQIFNQQCLNSFFLYFIHIHGQSVEKWNMRSLEVVSVSGET